MAPLHRVEGSSGGDDSSRRLSAIVTSRRSRGSGLAGKPEGDDSPSLRPGTRAGVDQWPQRSTAEIFGGGASKISVGGALKRHSAKVVRVTRRDEPTRRAGAETESGENVATPGAEGSRVEGAGPGLPSDHP